MAVVSKINNFALLHHFAASTIARTSVNSSSDVQTCGNKTYLHTELCQKLRHNAPRELFSPFQSKEFRRIRNLMLQGDTKMLLTLRKMPIQATPSVFEQMNLKMHQNNCCNGFLGRDKFGKLFISLLVGNR